MQALVKRSQELTASAQDQTNILSMVTKVTNAFDVLVVQTQSDIDIEEYRQVSNNETFFNFFSLLYCILYTK